MNKRLIWSISAIVILILVGSVLATEKPSVDLKWYGYFKLDGAYDRNMTSHGNFVMWVQPETQPGHDNQFNMTANETRFGVNATGMNYGNIKVSGKLEFDLYASITGSTIAENKAMLQLRHAYFSLESGHWKLTAGQTWDLISPLNPSTLNYSVLWGVGNIGYRRPQLSVWYNFKSDKNTDVTLAGGIFRTIGTDLTPTFTLALGETAEGADDGTDAAIPSFQGLLDVTHKLASGGQIRAGVSALTGKLQAETNQGNVQKYKNWVMAGHLQFNPTKTYGFSGEIYKGSNLGSFFGNILRASEVNGSADFGGWFSSWVQATSKMQFSAGYGMDDPDNADFASGRSRNSCVYGNVRYALAPQVTVGLELANWVTNYKNAASVKDFRTQSSLILSF